MIDALGKELKLGDYIVYAATTGIRIGRLYKYTEHLVINGFPNRVSIRMKVYDPNNSYRWRKWYEITIQPSRCLRIRTDTVPKEILDVLG